MTACPYCRGLHYCGDGKDGKRCQFPSSAYDDSNPRQFPWHPDARCVNCDREIDCWQCGDSGRVK